MWGAEEESLLRSFMLEESSWKQSLCDFAPISSRSSVCGLLIGDMELCPDLGFILVGLILNLSLHSGFSSLCQAGSTSLLESA